LDNTIYFTKPNAEILLGGLYRLLEQEALEITPQEFLVAKEEMLKVPFLKVAEKYNFGKDVIARALVFLKEEEVLVPLKTHNEYQYIKALNGLKFIVTAGFEKKQKTKLTMLGIANDFDEVYIVDVAKNTKKDVFEQIIIKYNFAPADVLVIGDDANAEIKYGRELGIDTFLYDPDGNYGKIETTYHSKTLKDLEKI
jgi:putative hydrolase of the HAD superfamily